VVIGVHTPEFPFEHDLENVRWAVEVMKVLYPVAIDNEYAIWRGFNNQYWPALYFVDAHGRVRHQQFGEGEYEQAERFIQRLLAEAGTVGVVENLVSVESHGVEAPADWTDLKSEENYVGYERTEGFASPGGAALDQPRTYAAPARLGLNRWALSGDWTVAAGTTVLNNAHGRIVYQFYARDLHLVMGRCGEPRSDSGCALMARRRAPLTELISTERAWVRSSNSGFTSSSDKRCLSSNGSSKSSFSIRAWRPTRSRSADPAVRLGSTRSYITLEVAKDRVSQAWLPARSAPRDIGYSPICPSRLRRRCFHHAQISAPSPRATWYMCRAV
jgi:hypothetical protein